MADQPGRTTSTAHPAGAPHRRRATPGPTGPTRTPHPATAPPGPPNPAGPPGPTSPAVTDQPRRPARTPGCARITATTPIAAATEQPAAITTGLTHPTTGPVGAVADQRPPRHRHTRRVHRIQQALRRGSLRARIPPRAGGQHRAELLMKPRHPPRQHLIIAPMLRKQPRDRRRHLILCRTSHRCRRACRRRTGRADRRPQHRQIRRRRQHHLRRHHHKRRHDNPPTTPAPRPRADTGPMTRSPQPPTTTNKPYDPHHPSPRISAHPLLETLPPPPGRAQHLYNTTTPTPTHSDQPQPTTPQNPRHHTRNPTRR